MVGRLSMELMSASGQESQHRPLGFWSKATISAAENYMPSEKQYLEHILGKDRILNYEAQSDHATRTVHFKLSSVGPAKS